MLVNRRSEKLLLRKLRLTRTSGRFRNSHEPSVSTPVGRSRKRSDVEYPKWVSSPSHGPFVVSSAEEEQALAEGRLILEVLKAQTGDTVIVKGIEPKPEPEIVVEVEEDEEPAPKAKKKGR